MLAQSISGGNNAGTSRAIDLDPSDPHGVLDALGQENLSLRCSQAVAQGQMRLLCRVLPNSIACRTPRMPIRRLLVPIMPVRRIQRHSADHTFIFQSYPGLELARL